MRIQSYFCRFRIPGPLSHKKRLRPRKTLIWVLHLQQYQVPIHFHHSKQGCRSRGFWVEPEPFFCLAPAPTPTPPVL